MRSIGDILARTHRELRANATITVYTFENGVEHRRRSNVSLWVEVSQQTGWQRARRSVHRMGRRRARLVLAFLPLALFIVGGSISMWIPPFHKPESMADAAELSDRLEWTGIGLLTFILIIPWMIYELLVIRRDPIVMRGEVVKKSEWQDEASLTPFFKWILGYDLVVNVNKAVKIGRDGYTEDQDLIPIGDEKDVESTRRVNRHIKELNQEIFFICNSTGRAVATLSNIHDYKLAVELIAVLDTAAAPDPATVPEAATVPSAAGT